MHTRKITRVVDAKQQGRVIIWLECHHKISIAAVDVDPIRLAEVERNGTYDCHFCPDPPPVPKEQTQSARQLWRDAGEP